MSLQTILLAVALGAAAGILSGLFGVGGGILFVPTLVALGLGQVEAAATSLLAIVPTAAVGVWRQTRFGNLRVRPALIVGVSSIAGVEAGVQIAIRIDESVLRRLFGVLLLVVAAQLVWRSTRPLRGYADVS
ncbi:MAG: sulfite exporter TauE/SafE family protein [Thermoleophilia bacterium]|nr:sulfite exporter TauE/SafE family protein [Thermoleophilia bacterium]